MSFSLEENDMTKGQAKKPTTTEITMSDQQLCSLFERLVKAVETIAKEIQEIRKNGLPTLPLKPAE